MAPTPSKSSPLAAPEKKAKPARRRRTPGAGKKFVMPKLAKIIRRPRARRIGLGLLPVGAVLVVFSRYIEVDAVHAFADRQNGALVFALLTVLPLVGFPVSVLHIAAGIRFGFGDRKSVV